MLCFQWICLCKWSDCLQRWLSRDAHRWRSRRNSAGGERWRCSSFTVESICMDSDCHCQYHICGSTSSVGSGFSYSKAGREGEMTDTKSALHTYEFLLKWLEDHPQYRSNPLYLCGESYGGIILPQVVQEIIRRNGSVNMDIHLGILSQIENLKLMLKCHILIEWGLYLTELYELWVKFFIIHFAYHLRRIAEGIMSTLIRAIFRVRLITRDLLRLCQDSGVNPYSILELLCSAASKQNDSSNTRGSMENIKEPSNCRDDGYKLSEIWANDDRVQTALRVRKGTITIKTWVRCNSYGNSDQVNYGVKYLWDVKSRLPYHRNISTKCYCTLIYSGDHDMRISHVSTEAWIRSLNISIIDAWQPWFVEGQVAGFTTNQFQWHDICNSKGIWPHNTRVQAQRKLCLIQKVVANQFALIMFPVS